MNKEMRSKAELRQLEGEKKSTFLHFLVRIVCGIVVIYVAYSLISSEAKKTDYQQQYEELTLQCEAVEEENALLSRYIDGSDEEAEEYLEEYIEQSAREKLDLAYPDERVYYIVPAN